MKQKDYYLDIITIGFAIFAIFFGAGNLIFPPYLGLTSQADWFRGFLCFSIADVGMAVVTMVLIVMTGGEASTIFSRLGKNAAVLVSTVGIFVVGPMVAIPRTCATTYDLSIKTLFPSMNSWIFTLIFFVLVALFSIRPSSVVDIIGKYLTPLLLATLAILIIKGVAEPIGTVSDNHYPSAMKDGFVAGYQTLDVLGALSVSIIILNTIIDKGYGAPEKTTRIAIGSCAVACVGLLLTYGGLCYLGATAIRLDPGQVTQTELVVIIVKEVLGNTGYVLLAALVLFACLTTAIGLTSSSSDLINTLTKGRVGYKAAVVMICVADGIVANVGTSTIIAFAAPVLEIVYPLVLITVLLRFFDKRIKNDWVVRMAAIFTLAVSLFEFADAYVLKNGMSTALPFHELGLAWIPFALLGMVIGAFVKKEKA